VLLGDVLPDINELDSKQAFKQQKATGRSFRVKVVVSAAQIYSVANQTSRVLADWFRSRGPLRLAGAGGIVVVTIVTVVSVMTHVYLIEDQS